MPSDPAAKVPLTVLCGWLGSGKTTLMRRCLASLSDRGHRVALIQNEFSDGDMEAAIVSSADDGRVFDDFIELAKGCICCTVRNDFVTALESLVQMERFDYIILECSGLADPGQIGRMFWVDEELQVPVYLDAIVTLVDAKHFRTGDAAPSLLRQIAFADRIVLNKADLVDATRLDEVEANLRAINVAAPIHRSVQCDVPVEQLTHAHAFQVQADDASLGGVERRPASGMACAHDHSIGSVVLGPFAGRPVDRRRLELWLADVLWDPDQQHDWEIFRLKGVVAIDGRRVYVQAVEQLFDLDLPGSPWPAAVVPYAKFIVIGKRIDAARLQRGLDRCFMNDQ